MTKNDSIIENIHKLYILHDEYENDEIQSRYVNNIIWPRSQSHRKSADHEEKKYTGLAKQLAVSADRKSMKSTKQKQLNSTR